MKLDFLNKEISVSEVKKDTYPTKKTINLYFKEDKTTRPSTVALYVLFFVLVGALAAKILVVDLASELARAEKEVEAKYAYIEEQMAVLKDYNDISSQYSRYSSSYLREDEKIVDRMDVLDMLEKTVFLYSDEEFVTITGDIVSVKFSGTDLQETANLVKMVEKYDMVASVEVSTATLSEGYSTNMLITLVNQNATEEAEETTGGEQ